MSFAPFTGAKRLRELLEGPKKIVVCPGVFDGLTARIALSKGFDAFYMVRARLVQRVIPCLQMADGHVDYPPFH